MQDPIGSFERVRELYLAYLDTAFRIRNDGVSRERRVLLRQPGTLCASPLLEPLPRYEVMPFKFERLASPMENDPLPGFRDDERRAFVELALAGLMGDFEPYTHQIEMLRRGVQPGAPGIITSGTGSGKTESFLLP